MNRFKLLREQVSDVSTHITSDEFRNEARKNDCDFTRNRKLPLAVMMLMIIFKSIKTSSQLGIDDFMEDYTGDWRDAVSKQAFSKSRTNLDPWAIESLCKKNICGMCKAKGHDYYLNKYRICAIDGSKTALYNSQELKDKYGTLSGSEKAVGFLNSMAYDPLNNIILDASTNHCDTSERDCAKAHIEAVSKLQIPCRKKNLYLLDRGYPSADFLSYLIDGKHKFVMRVRRKFNLDFDHVMKDNKVVFVHNSKTYRVRVIKVILPKTGEVETLVTNLNENELPYEKAGEIYFLRWGIETKFGSLKNKLELENMSGRRIVTMQQDYWATMLIANLYACLEYQTNAAIAENTADLDNKYEQTTNENRLIHRARKMFAKILLEPSANKRRAMMKDLEEYITHRPVEVKPDRSVPRSTPRQMRFHDNNKSVV